MTNQRDTGRLRWPLVGTALALFAGAVVFFTSHWWEEGTEKVFGLPMTLVQASGTVSSLEYRSESERLDVTRIQPIDGAGARRLVDEKVFLFGSLFEKQRVGYQGQHTEFVDCAPGFRPAYAELTVPGGLVRYFSGYANDRFVPGACDRESARHRNIYGYLFCEAQETLYGIDYFTGPDQSLEDFLSRLRCGGKA